MGAAWSAESVSGYACFAQLMDAPVRRHEHSVAEHEAIIRRWTDPWNSKDIDTGVALSDPNYVRHDANQPDVVGPGGLRLGHGPPTPPLKRAPVSDTGGLDLALDYETDGPAVDLDR